jgi:nuclear pore complex protein Nup155
VVADGPRNLLYALSSSNAILVYRPTSAKSIQHVQTIANLFKSVMDKLSGSPAVTSSNFRIISIHPIHPSESRTGIQFLAMTATGLRLYFAPGTGGYNYSYAANAATGPRQLQLSHIRLPPAGIFHPDEKAAFSRNPISSYASIGANQKQPKFTVSNLDVSCYIDGLTIAAQRGDSEDRDFLLCMSPDLTRIGNLEQMNLPAIQQPQSLYTAYPANATRPPYTEHVAFIDVVGRSEAIAPMPKTFSVSIPQGTPSPSTANELATQFSEPSRQILVLTNVGLIVLVKRRSIDYLKAVLEEALQTNNIQPMVEFRDR